MHPIVEVRPTGGQTLDLQLRTAVVVGRECDGLLIADPQVSRRHLELRPHAGGVLCTDLGSRNGTFVDGSPLTEPTLLDEGMVVTLGDTTLRLIEAGRGSAAAPGSETVIVGSDPAADPRRTSIDIVADEIATAAWDPMLEGETVTILFSDIEASTEHASALGDAAWFELLDGHNLIVREELAKTGGHEVKSQGDGFMLTFPSVRRALRFAVGVQKRLDSAAGSLRVRVGVHTGEAIFDATGDLFGRHVNKAARVANLAAGEQVLVSATVREIALGTAEFSFGDATTVTLKGLDGAHVVHELLWR